MTIIIYPSQGNIHITTQNDIYSSIKKPGVKKRTEYQKIVDELGNCENIYQESQNLVL